MLKGTAINNYRSKTTGLDTVVFKVTGTPEELAAYKEAQEKRAAARGIAMNVVDPATGNHLYWSTTAESKEITLSITYNGNIAEGTIDDAFDRIKARNAARTQLQAAASFSNLARRNVVQQDSTGLPANQALVNSAALDAQVQA